MPRRRSSRKATYTTGAPDARHATHDTRSLPARLLEMQDIARVVPALSPETLQKVIDHSGLEASLPLLALASSEQLHQVMDLDLWRSATPGLDEGFDVDRFGAWLESLVEVGDEFAADQLARMEPSLVIGAFAVMIRVFDLATLASASASDDGEDGEPFTTLASADIGGYRVVSRDAGPWDAIVSVLVALDSQHGRTFHRLMRGCRQLSHAGFEDDGLDNLLDHRSQAWFDQHGRRLLRREQRGYVAPAEARAFLRASRVVPLTSASEPDTDPTWQAFLRTMVREAADAVRAEGDASTLADTTDEARGANTSSEPAPTLDNATSAPHDARPALDTLMPVAPDVGPVMQLLEVEGVLPNAPRALLSSGDTTTPERFRCFHARLQQLFEHDADLFERRNLELSFLASVVASGCPVHGRTLNPTEATEAATAVCNLGLEAWPRAWAGIDLQHDVHPPIDVLQQSTLITAFQVGWRTLYESIGTHASTRLLRVLDGFVGDHPMGAEVLELRWRLSRSLKEGEPWRASEELDVIAAMDLPAWATLVGLIAEFPVMHPVLTIEPGRRVLSVDPRAFTYFSELRHLLVAHQFLDKLPDRLTN